MILDRSAETRNTQHSKVSGDNIPTRVFPCPRPCPCPHPHPRLAPAQAVVRAQQRAGGMTDPAGCRQRGCTHPSPLVTGRLLHIMVNTGRAESRAGFPPRNSSLRSEVSRPQPQRRGGSVLTTAAALSWGFALPLLLRLLRAILIATIMWGQRQ